MLFSFILQFERDRDRAEHLLEEVFVQLHQRIEEARASGLGLYCWLQRETRKIVLTECNRRGTDASGFYYDRLLVSASEEQRWVFREMYLSGRPQEELAKVLDREVDDIAGLLRGALLTIRKNLV